MRILWINPIGYEEFNLDTYQVLNAAKNTDTQVDLVSLPTDRPRHVQYHSYEALVVPDIVRLTYQAANKYEAVVIGCFYDIGLREAREVSGHTIVTAPCESATSIARKLGNTFSVLVSSRKCIPKMRENIRLYGHSHNMVSMRSLNVDVHDFQLDKDRTCSQMMLEGRKAVEEDGAEVLVLGCTAIYGYFQTMQDALGVPVIDAALAPFKYSEFLVDLASRFLWYPSRKYGSEAPPTAEVTEWGLFNQPAEVGATLKSAES